MAFFLFRATGWCVLALYLASCGLSKGDHPSTPAVVGNGTGYQGDPVLGSLENMRGQLARSLTYLQAGIDKETLCSASNCDPAKEATCSTLQGLDTSRREAAKTFVQQTQSLLADVLQKVSFSLSPSPLTITGANGMTRLVIARTQLGAQGDISFYLGAALALSPADLMAALAHELGHKVLAPQIGAYIQDGQPLGPFSDAWGGQSFLNSVGACIAVYAINHPSTPGMPDPTFNHAAMLATSLEYPSFPGFPSTSTAVQPDGKLIMVGGWRAAATSNPQLSVIRLTPSGSLDPSFATGGKLSLPQNGELLSYATAAAVQPDGKIVVAGYSTAVPATSGGASNTDFIVLRLDSSGNPDPAFGKGGVVRTAAAASGTSTYTSLPTALRIQPDGKILVAGQLSWPGDPHARLGLVRYLPDGSLDPSFNPGSPTPGIKQQSFWVAVVVGGTSVYISQASATPLTLALRADGEIGLGGFATEGSTNYGFAVALFKPDGSLDSSFYTLAKVGALVGQNSGGVITSFAGQDAAVLDLSLLPNGKVLAVGRANTASGYHLAAVQYNADGSPDPQFPTWNMALPGSAASSVSGVWITHEGMVMAAANSTGASGGSAVLLARYQLNGALDPSFGTQGTIASPVNIAGTPLYGAVATPDRLYVVGRGLDPTGVNQAALGLFGLFNNGTP